MRRLVVAPVLALLASVGTVVAIVPAPPAAAAGTTSRFEATDPCRLADSRAGTGVEYLDGNVVRVVAGGRCGVPADAVAVALTVTVDSSLTAGAGYVSIWPAGQPRPSASIINYNGGQVRANGTIIALGAGGAVDLFSLNVAPLIVDVTGWFVLADTSAEGRFVPITPARALDTRLAPIARPLAPGETFRVPLPPAVPQDAAAVAFTITLTESPGPGFFAVAPSGTPHPDTSVVNADGPFQTRASGSIVGVTPEGIDVYSSSGGHVIVDITGWFTGESAPEASDGLFQPTSAPSRLRDTRDDDPIWPAGTIEIANVAPNAAALVLNVAVVNPFSPGYLTAHAARQPQPPTSSVNAVTTTEVAASMAIVPASTAGIGVFSNAGADTVVDVSGWFIGTPTSAPGPAPANVRPPDCAPNTDADGLNVFFTRGVSLRGADYQRAFELPDGRVLWFFQDAFVTGRFGQGQLVHNAGLVQTGSCFSVLQSGNFAHPRDFLFAAETDHQRHWFWPLSGDMGADGRFHLFVAEMRENGSSYLSQTEPIGTWKVAIDLATMQVVDAAPAPNSSPSLYGFSVASDGAYSYLYAHCHRQFGWDLLPFSDPPVYAHDFDCSDDVTIGRVPKGQFDQAPQYWNGEGGQGTWISNPNNAANVLPGGRAIQPSQVYRYGSRWIAVTKLGDWLGDRIVIDIASNPQGPFTNVRTIFTPENCDVCNTYFASLLPWRDSDGSLLIGLSNNVFGPPNLSRYHPSILTTSPV